MEYFRTSYFEGHVVASRVITTHIMIFTLKPYEELIENRNALKY